MKSHGIARVGATLALISVFASAEEQQNDFCFRLKPRGAFQAASREDHLKVVYPCFGVECGYQLDFGRLETEVGFMYKGGRQYLKELTEAVGATYDASGDAMLKDGQVDSTLCRLDGADIKDLFQGQVDARRYVEDSNDNVAIVLSPLNDSYQHTSGDSIEVVTKSGDNEFSGNAAAAELTKENVDSILGNIGTLSDLSELASNMRSLQKTMKAFPNAGAVFSSTVKVAGKSVQVLSAISDSIEVLGLVEEYGRSNSYKR